jgi:hypothetical protein
MMEAIRMSLVTEEDRRRKEEKEAKKESKHKEKDRRKSEKAATKALRDSDSADCLHAAGGPTTDGSVVSGEEAATAGKGKHIDWSGGTPTPSVPHPTPGHASSSAASSAMPIIREPPGAQDVSRLQAGDAPLPSPSQPGADVYRPSHLRQVSNTSSTASSFVDSGRDSSRDDSAGPHASTQASSSARNEQEGRQGSGSEAAASPSPPDYQSLAAMMGRRGQWEDGLGGEHTEGSSGDKGQVRERTTESGHFTASA